MELSELKKVTNAQRAELRKLGFDGAWDRVLYFNAIGQLFMLEQVPCALGKLESVEKYLRAEASR